MKNSDITDPLFREAVDAIDRGDIAVLRNRLVNHPDLVSKRLEAPTDGYFKNPYLLWFVADNPIRHEKLPANIVEITRLLLTFVRQNAPESFQQQINYAFELIETGRIVRECGVQIALLDLLIAQGATPGDAHGALANGNKEAAKYIIGRSGKLTLTAAICLDLQEDVVELLSRSTSADKQVALIAAAFYGKPEAIRLLIKSGVDVNQYISSGFHSHASALHQAVCSGSLEAVMILVNAGGRLEAIDTIFKGTPLGWAKHFQTEEHNEETRKKYREIEEYLSTTRQNQDQS